MNDCVASGKVPFVAVNVIVKSPACNGVPLRTPALNVTPSGSVPSLRLMVGAGGPVAVTMNVPAVFNANVVLLALVICRAIVTGVV